MEMQTRTTAVLLVTPLVTLPAAPGATAAAVSPAMPPTAAATTAFAAGSGAAGRPTLRRGARGPAVRRLQTRLRALRYDPGAVDGRYGDLTVHAVWAFQKVNGLGPSSTVGPATWAALARPRTPRALVRVGAAGRIEISLRKQLLVLYKHGTVRLITHISSGSGRRYFSQGAWHTATTPTGNFKIFRRIRGWHRSPLGLLYNPVYFTGGVAVHGEGSVPPYPASHGCVRIPVHTGDLVYPLASMGTHVYVRR
ncbi:peptidoglycan-binding protein [Actinomadura scrupuli]|uniref:peptidoglycan-binding domain-containing protein n=1 Tax=Actinomadura scrupuli TaxID=559629 RepID=UPI003D99045C